jgi:hypothetical protein
MVVELVAGELDRVHERMAGRFGQAEPRARGQCASMTVTVQPQMEEIVIVWVSV